MKILMVVSILFLSFLANAEITPNTKAECKMVETLAGDIAHQKKSSFEIKFKESTSQMSQTIKDVKYKVESSFGSDRGNRLLTISGTIDDLESGAHLTGSWDGTGKEGEGFFKLIYKRKNGDALAFSCAPHN